MVALALLLASFLAPPPSGETVIVREPPGAQAAAGDTSVLGWRLVPADQVPPGAEVVPNVYLDLLATSPDGEPLATDQWPIATLGYARAWRESTGDGTLIAVVDSGIDLTHPDLADRIWHNPAEIAGNGIDDDANGLVDDVTGWDVVDDDNDPTDPSVGHGTEVAGVAVASINGTGIAGLAPGASIMPIRACSSRCELFAVAWAIEYATDLGADIINLSLGGYAQPGPLADAVDYAEAAGVLVVTAAGNGGTDIDGQSFVPADLPNPNLAAVAATDRDDRLWSDSNYGDATVDLAALAIFVAVFVVAAVRQVHVGVAMFAAACGVGVGLAGLPLRTVVSGFPVSLMVLLAGVTYFFGIAQTNGTVDRVISAVLRLVGERTALLPAVFFALTGGISSMGSPLAGLVMAPIGLPLPRDPVHGVASRRNRAISAWTSSCSSQVHEDVWSAAQYPSILVTSSSVSRVGQNESTKSR